MQKIQYVTRLQRETKSPPTRNVNSRTLLGGGWMVPLRNECLECDHRSDSFSSSPTTTPPPAMYSFNGKGCGKNPQTIVVWIIDQVASKEAKQQQHHQHQNCSRCVNRENLCIYIVIFLLRISLLLWTTYKEGEAEQAASLLTHPTNHPPTTEHLYLLLRMAGKSSILPSTMLITLRWL